MFTYGPGDAIQDGMLLLGPESAVGEGARFTPGVLVYTPGVAGLAEEVGVDPSALVTSLVSRFVRGDWGELPPEDVEANEQAVRFGERLLGSYPVGDGGEKAWVITEADRSITTVLLPSEY